MNNNDKIQSMIEKIANFPGLGHRSARRIVLYLLDNPNFLNDLIVDMQFLKEKMYKCDICSNIDFINPCEICKNPKRDDFTLCIVENISDMWSIERSGNYNGKYHILGGTLSMVDKITPENLNIDNILQRIKKNNIKEVILALNSTIDAQTTIFYIVDILMDEKIKITRPAFGIPIGADLDYIDNITLAIAMKTRQDI